jgi:predicted nucleic acid-binding protein
MIALDTSVLFAFVNRCDPQHRKAREIVTGDAGPHFDPAGILGELCYLVEERPGERALMALLHDLETAFVVDCGEEDFPRIRSLVQRHGALPLGFADACGVACAERRGGRVAAFDADFDVVGSVKPITVVGA